MSLLQILRDAHTRKPLVPVSRAYGCISDVAAITYVCKLTRWDIQ